MSRSRRSRPSSAGRSRSTRTRATRRSPCPTADAARLALRTQQVIAYETGVARVADPLGGSWAVEAMTAEIVERASALIAKIDEMGGALAAIEAGYFQREIQEAAYQAQKAIESKEQVVVGVNEFTVPEETPIPTMTIDPKVEPEQVARLAAFRARRDAAEGRSPSGRPRRGGEGRPEPDAADRRGGRRKRHARGDRRVAQDGLRRPPGHRRPLSPRNAEPGRPAEGVRAPSGPLRIRPLGGLSIRARPLPEPTPACVIRFGPLRMRLYAVFTSSRNDVKVLPVSDLIRLHLRSAYRTEAARNAASRGFRQANPQAFAQDVWERR